MMHSRIPLWHKAAGMTAAVGLLAAALLLFRWAISPPLSLPGEGPETTARRIADLDGDGWPETLHTGPDGLTVTAATGAVLLRLERPPLGPVRILPLSGEPVLLAELAPGQHAAFAYAPGQGLLTRLAWPEGAAVTPSGTLTAAIEAIAQGDWAGARLHFADAEAAAAHFRRWHGQIPAGTARVSLADQVDAGALSGHLVPVTIWVSGPDRVAALRGEAAFTTGDAVRIRQLELQRLPLRVQSWSEARRRLAEAERLPAPPHPVDAPFYGRFRFTSGDSQYAVDALTGAAEREVAR